MAIMINDSSRYAAAAASRALSLAIRAEALADEIDALHRDLRAAGDEPGRRAGLRCDTASGWMRQAGTELHDTAGHVSRIAAAMKPRACTVRWGECPEHGNTLTSTGGRTWCRVIGYGRKWDYDRAGLPLCTAPDRVPLGRCLLPLNRGTIFPAGHHTAITMASPLETDHPFARQRNTRIARSCVPARRSSASARVSPAPSHRSPRPPGRRRSRPAGPIRPVSHSDRSAQPRPTRANSVSISSSCPGVAIIDTWRPIAF
jgi:hypothetical protein